MFNLRKTSRLSVLMLLAACARTSVADSVALSYGVSASASAYSEKVGYRDGCTPYANGCILYSDADSNTRTSSPGQGDAFYTAIARQASATAIGAFSDPNTGTIKLSTFGSASAYAFTFEPDNTLETLSVNQASSYIELTDTLQFRALLPGTYHVDISLTGSCSAYSSLRASVSINGTARDNAFCSPDLNSILQASVPYSGLFQKNILNLDVILSGNAGSTACCEVFGRYNDPSYQGGSFSARNSADVKIVFPDDVQFLGSGSGELPVFDESGARSVPVSLFAEPIATGVTPEPSFTLIAGAILSLLAGRRFAAATLR